MHQFKIIYIRKYAAKHKNAHLCTIFVCPIADIFFSGAITDPFLIWV